MRTYSTKQAAKQAIRASSGKVSDPTIAQYSVNFRGLDPKDLMGVDTVNTLTLAQPRA